MLRSDYLKYSFNKELPMKLDWYLSVLSLEPTDSPYLKIENNKYYVMVNYVYEEIEDTTVDKPLFIPSDRVTLTKDDLINIESTVDTTYGRAIANYILITAIFGDKIPYINKPFSTSDIEKYILKGMKVDNISVAEYKRYMDAASLLQAASAVITASASNINMVAPPYIKEFKEKVKQYLTDKYGPNWSKEIVYVAEYKKILEKYDDLWLRSDPNTYGKIITSKVKQARSKMYLSFGAELGFDEKGENPVLVDNSLEDGYPLDREQLTSVYNTARAGSYHRGKETQKGGAVAKDILRATNGIVIENTDCGSNIFKTIYVTEALSKGLEGRYVKKEDGSIEPITEPKDYIGKTIEIRSPLYCKLGGKRICGVCTGTNMANHKHGFSLTALSLSSVILTSSLKRMHANSMVSIDVDIKEMIK